jgi:hypothetical protein
MRAFGPPQGPSDRGFIRAGDDGIGDIRVDQLTKRATRAGDHSANATQRRD